MQRHESIRRAAEKSRAAVVTPIVVAPALVVPDEHLVDDGESSDGDEQPLANLVANGILVPESTDEHVLECAPVAINATEVDMEIEEGHESQPLLHAIDEGIEEEQEVVVAMSVAEPSDTHGVGLVNETVDMLEDDDFLTSSQSSEVPLDAPASDDVEESDEQHTSGSSIIENASRSDIPLYDDGNFAEVYAASISPPLRMVEHQFKQLHWNESPLELHQPVTDEEVWRHLIE